ncbi:MAG: subclass B1 metallo-beta-lactamase [Cyclobacteriaceae bacterium]|nr:subclass B1 metallo-beta-lactamase [Cyclobacteriaceae bacterium]UYN88064.1 MAG: subclass B1 metallo-beta-lactamase [Cyclobacteriaceae bacterium]
MALPALEKNVQTVYKSGKLEILKLSDHVYQHISYLSTNDFGRVDCNGMIVLQDGEAIIFDTPADNESSIELIDFLTKKVRCKIIGIVPTHFHDDCIGGIETFIRNKIIAYASSQTISLLANKGHHLTTSFISFTDSLNLVAGSAPVLIRYFGKGHTSDNVVAYVPHDGVLFGGCLVKTLGATKGNLADATVTEWPETILRLKKYFPTLKVVIPGHGNSGDAALLDYTITLFEQQ